MTAPSPDDLPGLVEAVRAIGKKHRPASVRWNTLVCACGAESSEKDGLELHRSELIVAAMVEHLGLTEETCCADADEDTITCAELGEMGYVRHVTPWREVQP